jgi:hypothetical protein
LKDLGYLKPDEIRADTTPPSDVGDLRWVIRMSYSYVTELTFSYGKVT